MRSERSVRPLDGDRGMATAELAAALPILVLVLAFAVSLVSVGSARVRVQDAAREAARAAARDDPAMADRLAQQAAPGAIVSISSSADTVTAVVTMRANLLASWLPAVTVTGRAVAARETRPDAASTTARAP